MAAVLLNGVLLKTSKNHGVAVSRPLIVAAKFSTDSQKWTTAESSKNPLFDPKLAAMRRGTGGRSSFNGMVATVFGASGMLGSIVCNRLGRMGTQVIVPYRGDHYDILPLKLVGDLGQVLFFPYNLRDEESIRKAMRYSNVVINVTGRDWETKNFKYDDIHVTGPRTIARIARESGIKRLIHFSALNSSPNPKGIILPKGSAFLRSKYYGEEAVREEFPDCTIFRPADMWGQRDKFLQYYAHRWRRNLTSIALWDAGENTIKQPVYASDVATGVINALKDSDTMGKTYDCVGPNRYVLSDLVDYIYAVLRRTDEDGFYRRDMKWDIEFRLRVTLTEKLCPSWPVAFLGWDKMERDHTTDILSGNPTLEDLGVVNLTQLEDRIDWEIHEMKQHSYYDDELGEFPTPARPRTVPAED